MTLLVIHGFHHIGHVNHSIFLVDFRDRRRHARHNHRCQPAPSDLLIGCIQIHMCKRRCRSCLICFQVVKDYISFCLVYILDKSCIMKIRCKIHNCLCMLLCQIHHPVIIPHLCAIRCCNNKHKYIFPVLLHVHPKIHVIFLAPILNASGNRFAAFYQRIACNASQLIGKCLAIFCFIINKHRHTMITV